MDLFKLEKQYFQNEIEQAYQRGREDHCRDCLSKETATPTPEERALIVNERIAVALEKIAARYEGEPLFI